MKNRTSHLKPLYKAVFALAWCLPFAVSGQAVFEFDVPTNGWNNTGDPIDAGVSVFGKVDYSAYPSFTLTVNNDSSLSTEVTQIFVLKPMIQDDNGNDLRRAEALSLDAISPVSDTTGWEFKTALDNNIKNLNGFNLDTGNYFGVDIESPPDNRIDSGETLTFSFTMESLGTDESIDWLQYGEETNPHTVFKWQEVENYGSSKGYGWGDIPITAVPEPSHIAGLSIAGLAGLLFIRRRIKAKRAGKLS